MDSIVIGENVSFIGDAAFDESGLKNVVIPNGVTEIQKFTFSTCRDLETVTLPNGIVSIGNFAFYTCFKLKSINLPNSLRSIGTDAFAACYSLAALEIPSTVTTINNYAFQMLPNIYYDGPATGAPWGALCIGAYYEDSVYYYNAAKTQVVTVHRDAVSVHLPASVGLIRKSSFYGCSSLQSLVVDATTPPTVQADQGASTSYAFMHVPTAIDLVVPCESIGSYIAHADWGRFTNIRGEFAYDVSVEPNDAAKGYVDIISSPTCNNPYMIVEAVPYNGYRFAFWSDNNTDYLRNIEVTGDLHLVAYFVVDETQSIDEVESPDMAVLSENGNIIVTGNRNEQVLASDIMGRIVYSGCISSGIIPVPAGVYFVRVGNQRSKKVVVY